MSISYQNHAYSLITTNFHVFHKPHTLIRVDPYLKQFIVTKQRKTARPAAGLALLKPEAFAQARGMPSLKLQALA